MMAAAFASANPIAFSVSEAVYFACLSWLLFYCPGSLLLCLSRYAMKPGEAFCFSWVLGYLLTVTLYALSARLHQTQFFPVLITALIGVYGFFYLRRDWKSWRKSYCFRREWLPYAACLIFIAGFTWIAVDHWSDFGDKGLKLIGDLHSDTLLGPAMATQIKTAVPPENPMLGGEKYVYHYFPYIALTIFSKYFSFPLLSLTFVYFQILSQSLFFLTVLCLASRIFSDRWVRFAAVFFTVLVAHFEFKIGYAVGFMYYFWGLYFFSDFLTRNDLRSFFFCSLLWGAILSSLNVLSLMLLPSLVLFTLLHAIHKNPKTIPLLQLSGGVLLGYILWYFISYEIGMGVEGKTPLVQLGFPLAHKAWGYLKVFSPDFPEFLLRIKSQLPHDLPTLLFRKMNLLRFLFVYAVQGLAFLALTVAMLDLGIVGFVLALKSFLKKNFLSNPSLSFIGFTGMIGILCSWFLKWRNSGITHTYPLMSYGLLLFYSVWPCFELFKRKGRLALKVLLLLAVLYAVIYKIAGKAGGLRNGRNYAFLSSELLDAFAFMRKEIPPADLIIHPLVHLKLHLPDGSTEIWEHHNYLFPVFTERRSFFIAPNNNDDNAKNRLPGSDAERRHDWKKFFETEDSKEAFMILDKYGIQWAVSTQEEPLRFSVGNDLKPVYQNKTLTLFQYPFDLKSR